MLFSRTFMRMLREIDADLATWRAQPPRVRVDPSIDEFLCPTCDRFISDAGCPEHPIQAPLL